ncbi:beta-microseminoprotein E1-like [Anneissia japonica]|uniref:beta-microseminoprotein E1-like n=1 Tax=Anneissia japonica TaxID=1529436 RepID=UPI0014255F91|nr:beta-microseminoprotein E1-like [Anneissia japonica]
MQMVFRASLLLLVVVVDVSYAKYGCTYATESYFGPQKCKDSDGNEYNEGDTWRTKDCKNCECYNFYHLCCDLKPVYYDWKSAPKGCIAEWNPKTCKEEFVLESNPTLPCPYAEEEW